MNKFLRYIGSTIFAILGFLAITFLGLLFCELSDSQVVKIFLISIFGLGGVLIGKSIFMEYNKRGFISFISRVSATPKLDNLELEPGQIGTKDYSIEQIETMSEKVFLNRKIYEIRINDEPIEIMKVIENVEISGKTIKLIGGKEEKLIIKNPSRIRVAEKLIKFFKCREIVIEKNNNSEQLIEHREGRIYNLVILEEH